ncbi:hypothetical protein C8F01DRAFT_1236172 [Mycena amicta]|nr:hypothetical protein C8F01DRAFT_1236172 [Mycena amicta]
MPTLTYKTLGREREMHVDTCGVDPTEFPAVATAHTELPAVAHPPPIVSSAERFRLRRSHQACSNDGSARNPCTKTGRPFTQALRPPVYRTACEADIRLLPHVATGNDCSMPVRSVWPHNLAASLVGCCGVRIRQMGKVNQVVETSPEQRELTLGQEKRDRLALILDVASLQCTKSLHRYSNTTSLARTNMKRQETYQMSLAERPRRKAREVVHEGSPRRRCAPAARVGKDRSRSGNAAQGHGAVAEHGVRWGLANAVVVGGWTSAEKDDAGEISDPRALPGQGCRAMNTTLLQADPVWARMQRSGCYMADLQDLGSDEVAARSAQRCRRIEWGLLQDVKQAPGASNTKRAKDLLMN